MQPESRAWTWILQEEQKQHRSIKKSDGRGIEEKPRRGRVEEGFRWRVEAADRLEEEGGVRAGEAAPMAGGGTGGSLVPPSQS